MKRRVFKYGVLVLLALSFLGVSSDARNLNPAQQVSLPYHYSLVEWETGNLLSKWLHRVSAALPWNHRSEEERRADVLEYFRLRGEIDEVREELSRAAAQTGQGAVDSVGALEAELARLVSDRRALRDRVEEVLEATVSSVLSDQDIASWGEFTFPPVDFRLTEPPRLLVTSPRDRIERKHDVLLEPDVTVQQREEMERELEDTWDLSGLVVRIGGVATYPASIVNTRPLEATLETAAHEWLHNYLFFLPLGRYMFSSSEMQTLNETFADIAGGEIGEMAFQMFSLDADQPAPSSRPRQPSEADSSADEEEEEEFVFFDEMRKTRLRVDELLDDGKIEEAEAYMEERRRVFVDNGINIRKLNQAFFAFHGTYAEGPTSVSPIGDQLHQLRKLVPDLKTFVTTMSGISSYGEFLDTLDGLGAANVGSNAPASR